MTIVVDATAIVAIVTRDSAIDAYLETATRVVAPDLAIAEVLNVRWKYRRAGLVAPALETITGFFERINVVSSLPYAVDTDELSKQLDHPAYDCLYATIARREGGRLITADRRFARKLGEYDIDVVVFSSPRKA